MKFLVKDTSAEQTVTLELRQVTSAEGGVEVMGVDSKGVRWSIGVFRNGRFERTSFLRSDIVNLQPGTTKIEVV